MTVTITSSYSCRGKFCFHFNKTVDLRVNVCALKKHTPLVLTKCALPVITECRCVVQQVRTVQRQDEWMLTFRTHMKIQTLTLKFANWPEQFHSFQWHLGLARAHRCVQLFYPISPVSIRKVGGDYMRSLDSMVSNKKQICPVAKTNRRVREKSSTVCRHPHNPKRSSNETNKWNHLCGCTGAGYWVQSSNIEYKAAKFD